MRSIVGYFAVSSGPASAQVNRLLREGRVLGFGEDHFQRGSPTAIWLGQAVDEIADRITADRDRVLEAKGCQAAREHT